MADHTDDAWAAGDGFYKVTYGGSPAPVGPFPSIPELAMAVDLYDYPADGYIIEVEDGLPYSIPSLNPDDLMPVPA